MKRWSELSHMSDNVSVCLVWSVHCSQTEAELNFWQFLFCKTHYVLCVLQFGHQMARLTDPAAVGWRHRRHDKV